MITPNKYNANVICNAMYLGIKKYMLSFNLAGLDIILSYMTFLHLLGHFWPIGREVLAEPATAR